MRILITGASGFVGSRLTCHLLRIGHEVGVLLRETSTTDQLTPCIDIIALYRCSNVYSELVGVLQDFSPDVVIHVASLFAAQHSPRSLQGLISTNISFPTQLLEAMVACQINKFINTGSSWQHYSDHCYNPVNLYAATKQAFEAISQYYFEAFGISILTLKLFETYGPADPRKKIIPLLVESIDKGALLDMSPGLQQLDFVYIDDVCLAYEYGLIKLFEADRPLLQEYGVFSGMPTNLHNLVRLIEKKLNRKGQINWGGRHYRRREVMVPPKGLKWLPGWKPLVSLEEGIHKICQIR